MALITPHKCKSFNRIIASNRIEEVLLTDSLIFVTLSCIIINFYDNKSLVYLHLNLGWDRLLSINSFADGDNQLLVHSMQHFYV